MLSVVLHSHSSRHARRLGGQSFRALAGRFALGALVASLAWVRSAGAETAAIEWQAPPACPSQAELVVAVERLLNERIDERPNYRAVGKVRQAAADSYELDLYIRVPGGRGVRQLVAEDCASLMRVAAFSIALAINPDLDPDASIPDSTSPQPASAPYRDAAQSVPAPQPSTTFREPAAPAAAAASEVRRPESAATTLGGQGWLGLEVLLDASLLPKPSIGAGLALEGIFRNVVLGLTAGWLSPQQHMPLAGAGGEFSLQTGELRTCYCPDAGRFGLGPCALYQLNRLTGEGVGVSTPKRRTLWVHAPGLGGRGFLHLTPHMAVTLHIGAVFPLFADWFEIDGVEVHRVPRLAWRGHLGFEVAIP